ncbi:MAG: alpha/beta hydrolase [Gammaproteobacteria bacterium]|nr:alpha/beta hydrolase [Gammaproteobacteria bacterium]
MFKKTTIAAAITISTSVLLVACGGGNGDNNGTVVGGSTTGSLQGTPTTPLALSAAQFTGALQTSSSGTQLLQLSTAGTATPNQLPCGVTVSHIVYSTAGGAGEATNASAAVMVPTGTGAQCTGARPIVLYAHGTTADQTFNMANITTNSEATLVAASFAAQGYIVIAPNYVGYDLPTSGTGPTTLTYHPYVNYKQQSQEMIDALKAGRAALATSTVASGSTDSGKLYVTGYSEGGYVAMAALKGMDAAGIKVTAGAPMSGPYNLAAYGDAIFYGNTPLGGTLFAPLLTTSYQKAYGNIYSQPSDGYTANFASNVEGILANPTFAASLLSPTALPGLFQSIPDSTGATTDQFDPITKTDVTTSKFSFGFSPTNFEVQTTFRAAYVQDAAANPDGAIPTVTTGLPASTPANPLRQAFKANDLRGYLPSMPVLMCGGHNDPTVFFKPNGQLSAGVLANIASSGTPLKFALLDVDQTAVNGDTGAVPFASTGTTAGLSSSVLSTMGATATQLQTGFAQSVQATAAATPTGVSPTVYIASQYHGSLVPPFCTMAARTFFQQY